MEGRWGRRGEKRVGGSERGRRLEGWRTVTSTMHSPHPLLCHMQGGQGRRKRSGWSGFGRTNIEGESGRVRIAAVAARASRNIVLSSNNVPFLQSNVWGTLILGQTDVPAVWNLR